MVIKSVFPLWKSRFSVIDGQHISVFRLILTHVSIFLHIDARQYIQAYSRVDHIATIFENHSQYQKAEYIASIFENHLPKSKEAEYIAPIFKNLLPYVKETEYIATGYHLQKSLTHHIQKMPSILLPCSEITHHLRICVWGVQTTSCPSEIFSIIVHDSHLDVNVRRMILYRHVLWATRET